MAGSLLQDRSQYLKAIVALDSRQQYELGQPWRDADGNLYIPGDITKDGNIVSASPGDLISRGVVYLDRAKLPEAEAAGWRVLPYYTGELVQVQR